MTPEQYDYLRDEQDALAADAREAAGPAGGSRGAEFGAALEAESVEQSKSRPRPALRKAIDEKCRDCIYDSEAPGFWREQVQACEITRCPLWPVRPKSYAK